MTEVEFRLETLVSTLRSTSPTASATRTTLTERTPESAAVVELCRVPHSIAEIAALARIPVGVAQVLVSDLVRAGFLVVHHSGMGPDLALMERVLRGLQHLR